MKNRPNFARDAQHAEGDLNAEIVRVIAGTENYIKRIYDFRKEELGKEPDKTENIFCHTDGTAVGEYSGGFENLLKKCDLCHIKIFFIFE